MNIIFLAPYAPFVSPSQRFRFEHYLQLLQKEGIQYNYSPFADIKTSQLMFSNGSLFTKVKGVTTGFVKRFILLFKLGKYDYVYIHREATPLGPPLFEWVTAKILNKKIIYDFDDNIWIKMSSTANPTATLIKCRWKVKYICKWSYITTAGNDYLLEFASKYCKKAILIPTVVDTSNLHNRTKNQHEEPLTIGWTGTFFNFIYFYKITQPIRRLQEKYKFRFVIIADRNPQLTDVAYDFIKWNKASEIEDLLKLHIGLMPLDNTEIEFGKCAFKAIQYMSLGIPAIVSPVSANCKVVDDGINGYWADTEQEWYAKLETLLLNPDKRIEMGKLAQQKIENQYSVSATSKIFLDLFKSVNPQ